MYTVLMIVQMVLVVSELLKVGAGTRHGDGMRNECRSSCCHAMLLCYAMPCCVTTSCTVSCHGCHACHAMCCRHVAYPRVEPCRRSMCCVMLPHLLYANHNEDTRTCWEFKSGVNAPMRRPLRQQNRIRFGSVLCYKEEERHRTSPLVLARKRKRKKYGKRMVTFCSWGRS